MNKRLLLIVCGILWFLPGKAQEGVDSMRIYYVVGHRAVSYTHLDVYKRQLYGYSYVWARLRRDVPRGSTEL